MRLIDADELMATLRHNCYPVQHDMTSIEPGMTLMGMLQAIQEQPTIEPQRWIPITERLPGAYNIVLVTLINGDVTIGRYDADTYQWSVYSGNWWNARGNDILAWMPLPTQYIVE